MFEYNYKFSPELFEWNNQFKYNPEEYEDRLGDDLREFYRLYELIKKTGNEDLKGLLNGQYDEIFFTTKNLMVDGVLDKEVRDEINNYLGELYYDRL